MLRKIAILLISLFFTFQTRPQTCNIIAKEDLLKGIRQQIVPNAWNKLENPKISDHYEKGGHHLTKWSYQINGCGSSISDLNQNSIIILLSEQANTLALQIYDIDVSAHCNAHVKTKILRTHGKVSAQVHFTRIAATLRPTYYDRKDGLRAPDFELVSSSVDVGKLHIHVNIHRVPGFIDNLISSALKDIYASKIKHQFKSSLDKAIHKQLLRIRTTTKLSNEIEDTGLQLVYDLASAPIVHDSWIQVPVDCTVYPINNTNVIRPSNYRITSLPGIDTSQNSEIHLSDYLVNSFLWAAAMKPYVFPVNNEILKIKKIESFMTTRYFTKIIPEFGEFDDLELEGLLYFSQEDLPKAEINDNEISAEVKLIFQLFFAEDKEHGATFELSGNIKLNMHASPGNSSNMMLVYGKIEDLILVQCKVVSSSIGELEVQDLTMALQAFLTIGKNIINAKILNQPYPIGKQVMRLVEVHDGSISLHQGYATVGLNIKPEQTP